MSIDKVTSKLSVDEALENEMNQILDNFYSCMYCEGMYLENQFVDVFPEDMDASTQSTILEQNQSDAQWVSWAMPIKELSAYLRVCEIEVQFDGDANDYFEDPDDWHINGNLAYCSTGYGLIIEFDKEGVLSDIAKWKEEQE